jgi:hypothetical protein
MQMRKTIIDELALRYRTEGSGSDYKFFCEANHLGVNIYLSKSPMVAHKRHSQALTTLSNSSVKFYNYFAEKQSFMATLDSKYVYSDAVKAEQGHKFIALAALNASVTGDDLSKLRETLKESGWSLSDEEFSEAVTAVSLSPLVRQVGTGEITLGDYLKARKACLDRGLPISTAKEFQWFRKFILPRKVSKVMPFAKVGNL